MYSGVSPIGTEWQSYSSVCGEGYFKRNNAERVPTRLIDVKQLSELLSTKPTQRQFTTESLREFCSRLHAELCKSREDILAATQQETLFNRYDCEEVVQSCLEYVEAFPKHLESIQLTSPPPICYGYGSEKRSIEQIAVPWGTIAAILPQSAFFFLALTCMLNALAAGNRVILRVPSQSTKSAELLRLALERIQMHNDSISIAIMPARAFISTIQDSPEPLLLHYLGSSTYAPDILSSCFQSGKQVLIDGEGNAWVWVDEDVSVEYAVNILTSGALRYNGQTCTSINGAVIHPKIYDQVKKSLVARWNSIVFGNPLESDVQVGPLLSEAQAEQCLAQIDESNAAILAGGYRQGSLLTPTLAAQPRGDSKLVAEGLFGPALWIMPGDFDEFTSLWRRNRYPLCAGILSQRVNAEQHLRALPNLARLVVNADPSLEHIYEPWGGYSGSGNNTVSDWFSKYQRIVQVDTSFCKVAQGF